MDRQPLNPRAWLPMTITVKDGRQTIEHWAGHVELRPPMLLGTLDDARTGSTRPVYAQYVIRSGTALQNLPVVGGIASAVHHVLVRGVHGELLVHLPIAVRVLFDSATAEATTAVSLATGQRLTVHVTPSDLFKGLAQAAEHDLAEAGKSAETADGDKKGDREAQRRVEARIRQALALLSLGDIEESLEAARLASDALRLLERPTKPIRNARDELAARLKLLALRHPRGHGLQAAAALLYERHS
ncbi:hypothetical protein [Catellatospora sp. NPDC049609]|uniref:hypothetical protein n=1 Tax=Catellatospora sp. NPDC049609 TaxID=3155505 RepID=UPI00341CAD3A